MHIFFLGGEREQEEKEDTCKARLAKEVTGWSRREEVMAEEAVAGKPWGKEEALN